MKNRFSILLAAVLMTSTVAIPGCWFGQKARNGAVRQLQVADDGVRADADSGVGFLPAEMREQATQDIADFFEAVSGDRPSIQGAVGQWAQIRSWAEVGIAGRESAQSIGPGVASSKRLRLSEFERTFYNIAGVSLPPGVP